MNLLNFIEIYDLHNADIEYINLHTRNHAKARAQCEQYFANHDNNYFYTQCTHYNNYAGIEYELRKSIKNTYYLIKRGKYEI